MAMMMVLIGMVVMRCLGLPVGVQKGMVLIGMVVMRCLGLPVGVQKRGGVAPSKTPLRIDQTRSLRGGPPPTHFVRVNYNSS